MTTVLLSPQEEKEVMRHENCSDELLYFYVKKGEMGTKTGGKKSSLLTVNVVKEFTC